MCRVSLQKRLTLCTRLAISSLDTSRWWGLKVIFMVSGSIFMAFRFGKNQAQLPKRVRGVGLELGHSSTTENQVDGFGLNRAPLPAPLPRMVGPLSMDQRLTENYMPQAGRHGLRHIRAWLWPSCESRQKEVDPVHSLPTLHCPGVAHAPAGGCIMVHPASHTESWTMTLGNSVAGVVFQNHLKSCHHGFKVRLLF